jgi:site-specific DNA-methyltransferase (adenine-specific)
MINETILGDCLEIMKKIPDESVDMVLCDLPYGTTQCKWDTIIPFEPLWAEYNRVCKLRAPMIFTASQPFTSRLINSNIKNFKYTWVWEKSKATGYLNAKRMPMRAHEDICVFYKKPPIYNPQMRQGDPYNKGKAHRPTEVYGSQVSTLVKNDTGLRYPRTVVYFKTAESEGKVHHPTQKPVALFEYLIKTYSNEGDIILDSCMGAGTTGLAAFKTGRRFIGIDSDPKYVDIANQRINDLIKGKQNE